MTYKANRRNRPFFDFTKAKRALAAFVLAPLLITGCIDHNPGEINTMMTEEADGPFIYKLEPGDKIRITVYREKDLSGEFELDEQGLISIPYIKEVTAKGLSAAELAQKITAQFVETSILKDPKISVDVLSYRPFYIYGEVIKSGEYPYRSGLDLKNAVAMAGGYTYRAEIDTAYVRREGQEGFFKIELRGKPFRVRPGDNIKIPERFF